MRMWNVLLVFACAALLLPQVAQGGSCTSQVQIEARLVELNVDTLYGRTPLGFQYTTARTVIDHAVFNFKPQLSYRLELDYHDYDFLGLDDKAWTGAFSYEKAVDDRWGWGLQAPEQYWETDDYGSLWYEGVTGYGYYNLSNQFRLGGFGHLNYAWADIDSVPDEFSYGFGAFGSYRVDLSDQCLLVPAFTFLHYGTGQDGWDNSNIFSLGSKFYYTFTPQLTLEGDLFYFLDKSNDLVDDSFWKWDMGLRYYSSETFELNAGIGTTEGFSDFDRLTFRVGLRLSF